MANMKEFFTSIKEGEDPDVEIDTIGSPVGKLAYSAVAFFDRRLGHEIPTPIYEKADFDTNIEYPFETRTVLSYTAFAFDFFYEFFNFAVDMPSDTYLNSCDRSIQDWAYYVDQCKHIYEDFQTRPRVAGSDVRKLWIKFVAHNLFAWWVG